MWSGVGFGLGWSCGVECFGQITADRTGVSLGFLLGEMSFAIQVLCSMRLLLGLLNVMLTIFLSEIFILIFNVVLLHCKPICT